MTRRALYADTAALGRFPLHPGRPLVHQRRNGNWGWTCDCTTHRTSPMKPYRSASCNSFTWTVALREALDHLARNHKTPARIEVEELEALYALLPTRENTR